MVPEEDRKSIINLHENKHVSIKELARIFGYNRKTIRKIIREYKEAPERRERKDKINIDQEVLLDLYVDCAGYRQRMWEKLTEEMGYDIGYSTLTRLLRENNIGNEEQERMGDFPDIPGCEFQHDTSDYKVMLGDKQVKVICSALYYRFSKIRYIKFYKQFNRFLMKCFFHEALLFYGYVCKTCIIDNTHLAILHGTGKNAVIVEEMKKYAELYGFEWQAHEVNHSNRKAGKERNFRTINTNFFPGRTFKSLADLNEQVFKWGTVRYFNRPQSKTKLIPSQAFNFEKTYMKSVSPHIPAPYLILPKRKVDPKGYIAFNGNYYWTPEGTRGYVDALQYEDTIKIIQHHKTIAEYKLPEWDVKNQKFSPDGKTIPLYEPKNIKKGCKHEEESLAKIDDVIGKYITYIKQKKNIPQKPRLIRQLYSFSKKLTPGLFIKTMNRALAYQIHSISEIEAIATELMKKDENNNHPAINSCLSPDDFNQRDTYRRGRLSKEQDSQYLRKLQKGDNND